MGLAVFIAWLKTLSYVGREDHQFRLCRETEGEREQYEADFTFVNRLSFRGR